MISEMQHQLNATLTWTTTTLSLLPTAAPGTERRPLSHAAITRIGESAPLIALCDLTHVTLVRVSIAASSSGSGGARAMSSSLLASFAVGGSLLFSPAAGMVRQPAKSSGTPSWHVPVLQQLLITHSLAGTPCNAIKRCGHASVCAHVVWCGAVWCGVVWCGVVWCGVVWCGVVWCGVVGGARVRARMRACACACACALRVHWVCVVCVLVVCYACVGCVSAALCACW
jgi:hypothetical protein